MADDEIALTRAQINQVNGVAGLDTSGNLDPAISGTIDHDDLDNVSANQHHAQVHDNADHSTAYEPAFSKNTAFNKNFGSASNTVCEGNDSRLSDARTDNDAIHDNAAGEINAITGKTTPVDADVAIIEDSETTPTTYQKKKLTWANTKATLKTYFDTLYSAIGHTHTHASTTGQTTDDHHAKLHASSHSEDGIDEILVENLGTASATSGQMPTANGSGGLTMQTRYAPYTKNAWSSTGATIGGNQNGYLILGGEPGITATESNAEFHMPKGRLAHICGRCTGAGSSCTLTVRKNGANTAIDGTVSATGRFEFNNSGTPVSFAEGNILTIAYSTSAGAGTTFRGIEIRFESEVA